MNSCNYKNYFLLLAIFLLATSVVDVKGKLRGPVDLVTTEPDTTFDTTVDTTVDTTADTTVDTTVDTTLDTTVDTTVDTTADTTVDTTVDTTPVPTTPTPTTTAAPVRCTTNADCPSDLPFCQQNTLTSLNFCQVCLTDLDCRASQRCNAVCLTNNFGINKCSTPVGQTRLQCSHSQVCYISQASCQQSCIPTGNTPSGAAASCTDPTAF